MNVPSPARTQLLTLPDGRVVRIWRREAQLIKADVAATGSVMLVRSVGTDVYERVAPASLEARSLEPFARRVGR